MYNKIAEENPDLSYDFIKNILLSLEDESNGHTEEYVFGADEKKAMTGSYPNIQELRKDSIEPKEPKF